MLFVGLDVIGGYVTEINVTSPTGVRELDEQFGIDVPALLIDAIDRAGWSGAHADERRPTTDPHRTARQRGRGPARRSRDRLTTMLFLAALLHAHGHPGRHLHRPGQRAAAARPAWRCCWSPTTCPRPRSNDSAAYLAQRTQTGSGNTPRTSRRRSSPIAAAPVPPAADATDAAAARRPPPVTQLLHQPASDADIRYCAHASDRTTAAGAGGQRARAAQRPRRRRRSWCCAASRATEPVAQPGHPRLEAGALPGRAGAARSSASARSTTRLRRARAASAAAR